MNSINLAEYIPQMISGEELRLQLTNLPRYSSEIRKASINDRLIALSDIYQIYYPFTMSVEIYCKLYLALLHSLRKKCTSISIRQQIENFDLILKHEFNSILGGADSFSIIGISGIGKSTTINRVMSLITKQQIIKIDKPFIQIIPCLNVQCPFDSSVKGLLLEILRKVDNQLNTTYYEEAIHRKATTDALIGCVSQVAINHIGLLVVDEIQNVCTSKSGHNLIGCLTQLINSSGISLCFVGTPECADFFESTMQLARRSIGLSYGIMKYNDEFEKFCDTVFSYQYTEKFSSLDKIILNWLYEHSGGITSVVVSLIHDAQEIAILNGREKLDLESLNEAYFKRISIMKQYINIPKITPTRGRKEKQTVPMCVIDSGNIDNINLISQLISHSKNKGNNPVEELKKHFSVDEVKI